MAPPDRFISFIRTIEVHDPRQVLLADVTRRATAGQPIGREAPLLVQGDGSAATRASVARARRLNAALIRSGNAINVDRAQDCQFAN